MNVSDLPAVNASLNGASTILLVSGLSVQAETPSQDVLSNVAIRSIAAEQTQLEVEHREERRAVRE